MFQKHLIAVVIPSYKVRDHILAVIEKIGLEVSKIYVVDDCCPEDTGGFVKKYCRDERVSVIRNQKNMGVGGAVITGYREAISDGADIIVKIDGDGQMDPELIPRFIDPIIEKKADYTKGNRFFDLEGIRTMPRLRLLGNSILSLMAKLSTGYWDLFDPTNGYTSIHSDIAKHLPLEKISRRYFFETDILFRLNTIRAVVLDVPMGGKYGNEESNLKIKEIICEFFYKHLRNFIKRIFYNYYLRDLSIASIELPLGVMMLLFGLLYGGRYWFESAQAGLTTPAGTVMLSALPILLGIQLILAFLNYDIASVPKSPRHIKIRQNYSISHRGWL